MINEIISMNGYGAYVWSAFSFTLISFATLYFVTKLQFSKEQKNWKVIPLILTLRKLELREHKILIEKYYPIHQIFNL